ncbi:MAG: YkgJ family cysteine cluster protein [Deltaproteobacteria bacterium]|jgi:Fe-S-cluster containining protein|nr:YkgJ family cysteine cluster protein [Deltaproteobacteria bacterium]MBW2503055.1 YkgJ family cysteine cluster protein [Deltaproteobacteria bacterium]
MRPISSLDLQSYAGRVADYTRAHLGTSVHEVTIAGHMHLLTVAVERDLLRFGCPEELANTSCARGCSACCMINVSVLAPEAIAISWYLKRHVDPSRLESIRRRLHEVHRKTRWLDDEERLFLREPCPLLDSSGACIIHPVRPLLCRSITSSSRDLCQEAISMAPLQGVPMVPMNVFQKSLYEMVYQGLAHGLAESGLDDRPWRLATALDALLRDQTLVCQYVGGGQVVAH